MHLETTVDSEKYMMFFSLPLLCFSARKVLYLIFLQDCEIASQKNKPFKRFRGFTFWIIYNGDLMLTGCRAD